jgi:hypothetical protein
LTLSTVAVLAPRLTSDKIRAKGWTRDQVEEKTVAHPIRPASKNRNERNQANAAGSHFD